MNGTTKIRLEHVHRFWEPLELGPFLSVQFAYTVVFVQVEPGKVEAIAYLTSHGTWKIGLEATLLKKHGTQYDGNEYTDLTISTRFEKPMEVRPEPDSRLPKPENPLIPQEWDL